MWMTSGQIARSYLAAKNPKKQITILKQLNSCSESDIVDCLERSGISVRMEKPKKKKREVKHVGRWQCDPDINAAKGEFDRAFKQITDRYTQSEIASITGIQKSSVSNYANHRTRPDTEKFEKILVGFGMSREQFFALGRADG